MIKAPSPWRVIPRIESRGLRVLLLAAGAMVGLALVAGSIVLALAGLGNRESHGPSVGQIALGFTVYVTLPGTVAAYCLARLVLRRALPRSRSVSVTWLGATVLTVAAGAVGGFYAFEATNSAGLQVLVVASFLVAVVTARGI